MTDLAIYLGRAGDLRVDGFDADAPGGLRVEVFSANDASTRIQLTPDDARGAAALLMRAADAAQGKLDDPHYGDADDEWPETEVVDA